jgi:hypothetical protein
MWLARQVLVAGSLIAIPVSAVAEDQTVEVTGSVTNSVTGEAVERAQVFLSHRSTDGRKRDDHIALTDSAGKFSLEKLAPGLYAVSAGRTGLTGGVDHVTLSANEPHRELILKLTPLGAISGLVLDPNGDPLESVSVTTEVGRPQVSTDEHGRFRIGALSPGKYIVQAADADTSSAPEIRTDGTVERHIVPTYYPGSPDIKAAQQIEVRPGEETRGLEIHVVVVPMVGIRGKVIGIPVGARMVMVSCGHHSSSVAPDGSFALWRLDPGKCTVSASGFSASGQPFQTELVDLQLSSGIVDHVDLRVLPPFQINGRLEFEDDRSRRLVHPQSSAGKTQEDAPQLSFRGNLRLAHSFQAPINEDDSFRADGVQPARYRINLTGILGVYVKSITVGSKAVEGTLLDLGHGGNAEDASGAVPLSILISSTMGSLSGTVRDETGPAPGVNVYVIESAGDEETMFPPAFFAAKTSENGTYSFGELPPGNYRLLSFLSEKYDPTSMRGDASGQDIEIRAGENTSKDLTKPAY